MKFTAKAKEKIQYNSPSLIRLSLAVIALCAGICFRLYVHLSGIGDQICKFFAIAVICIGAFQILLSLCEMFLNNNVHKDSNLHKDVLLDKTVQIGYLFDKINSSDIWSADVKIDGIVHKIGTSSDYNRKSDSFYDKKFLFDDSEYATLNEMIASYSELCDRTKTVTINEH